MHPWVLLASEEASRFYYRKCNWSGAQAQSNPCWGQMRLKKANKQHKQGVVTFILEISMEISISQKNTGFAAQLILCCKKNENTHK